MRAVVVAVFSAIFLAGCITTGGLTGSPSLESRVTRIESRLNGSQDPTASAGTRRRLEQRLENLYQGINQVVAKLEDLGKSNVHNQKRLDSLYSEVSLLRNRLDSLEAGRLTGEAADSSQVSALQRRLIQVEQKAEKANVSAAKGNEKMIELERDLRQRISFFDNEIRQIYRDIMTGLDHTRPEDGVHVVADGETLGGIAARYGLSIQEVLDANPDIQDRSLIRVGQKITIP